MHVDTPCRLSIACHSWKDHSHTYVLPPIPALRRLLFVQPVKCLGGGQGEPLNVMKVIRNVLEGMAHAQLICTWFKLQGGIGGVEEEEVEEEASGSQSKKCVKYKAKVFFLSLPWPLIVGSFGSLGDACPWAQT